jgi:hypothetical protein
VLFVNPAFNASLIASIPSYAKHVISKSALTLKDVGVNLLLISEKSFSFKFSSKLRSPKTDYASINDTLNPSNA